MSGKGTAGVFKSSRYLWIIFAFVAVLYFSTLNNFFQENVTLWDGCNYMMLAKSLSEGSGYQILGSPHTIAPFMFPLLLAPIGKCFGYNIFLMRLLEALFAISGVMAVFILFREIRSQRVGLIVALWTGLSPLLLYQATEILSEIPYLFFSVLALFFIHKTMNADKVNSKYLWLSILFMEMSYYTRSIGLSFLFALLLFLCLETWSGPKRAFVLKKGILLCSGFVILIIPWLLRNQSLTGYSLGYYGMMYRGTGSPMLLITTVKTNFLHYQEVLFHMFASNPHPYRLLSLFILILIGTGFFSSFLSKNRTIVDHYFVVSIFVLLAYPFKGGGKYVLTYLPFFFYYIALALSFFVKTADNVFDPKGTSTVTRYVTRAVPIALAILSLSSMVFSDIGIIKKERRVDYYSPLMVDIQRVCEYINAHTPEGAGIMVPRIHPYIGLATGRKVFLYQGLERDLESPADTEMVINDIERINASYLMTDGSWLSEKSLGPVIKVNEGQFEKVFTQGTCSLHRVIRPIDKAKWVYLKDGQISVKLRPVENRSGDKVGPWDQLKPGGQLDAAILVESMRPDQIEKILISGRSALGHSLQVYPPHKGIWSAAIEPAPGGTVIYFEP
jgi:4-amino-4-deoxy-L-arabinose transferase-like glycosyltransferase